MKALELHGKSVIVHFGPPKTGTSAIQNWLVKNRALLLKQGFFYPEHGVDTNGVSSGHVWNLCKKSSDLSIEQELLAVLMSDFFRSGADTLILSSEFFFGLIEELYDIFPKATFIGYVRNPIDLFESSYSQSIKRHQNAKGMTLPKRLPLFSLRPLLDLLESKSLPIVLRAYHPEAFENNSVVNDFCLAIGISMPTAELGYINRSYAFEAMEFKRWFNGFDSQMYSPRMDAILQKYSSGARDYTLIPKDKYSIYQKHSAQCVKKILRLTKVHNGKALVSDINKEQNKVFRPQALNVAEVDRIVLAIKTEQASYFEKLCLFIKCGQIYPNYYSWITQRLLSQETMAMKLRNCIRMFWHKSVKSEKGEPAMREVSNVKGLEELKKALALPTHVSDGIIMRELAILAEKNNQLPYAYTLMMEANRQRPNGPLITSKLKKYAEKLAALESKTKAK